MFPSRAIDKETFPLHFHSKWKTILLLHSSKLQLCLQIEQDELNLNLVQAEDYEKKHSSSNVSRKQGPTLLSQLPNLAMYCPFVVQWQQRLKELGHLGWDNLCERKTLIQKKTGDNNPLEKEYILIKERKGVFVENPTCLNDSNNPVVGSSFFKRKILCDYPSVCFNGLF